MTTIAACASYTLHEIYLANANFDSDQSVMKLAEILATTPCLTKCDIRNQLSSREVRVEVLYATNEETGAVVMKDRLTGREICRHQTPKR